MNHPTKRPAPATFLSRRRCRNVPLPAEFFRHDIVEDLFLKQFQRGTAINWPWNAVTVMMMNSNNNNNNSSSSNNELNRNGRMVKKLMKLIWLEIQYGWVQLNCSKKNDKKKQSSFIMHVSDFQQGGGQQQQQLQVNCCYCF